MNYTPRPIEGCSVSLTSRQKLAHVRKALADVNEAKRYWPYAEWHALIADLSSQEAVLADEIRRADEAVFNQATLRPVFVNAKTNGTMRAVVLTPNEKFDMPHIDESSWRCILRVLGDGAIKVRADYDVYVVRGARILSTIERTHANA